MLGVSPRNLSSKLIKVKQSASFTKSKVTGRGTVLSIKLLLTRIGQRRSSNWLLDKILI